MCEKTRVTDKHDEHITLLNPSMEMENLTSLEIVFVTCLVYFPFNACLQLNCCCLFLFFLFTPGNSWKINTEDITVEVTIIYHVSV